MSEEKYTPMQFIRLPRVMAMTGLGRTQTYALMAQGRFPKKVKLSANTTVWIESEIQSWMANRVQESRRMAP